MKGKANKSKSNSARKHSWRMLLGVVAVTLLVVGVVGAVSNQSNPPALKRAQAGERKSQVSDQTGRHYVTTNAAGQPVVQDRQTGETRPLTRQEAETLAQGLKQLINPTDEGLVQVRQANGMVSMDLQGHYQNVSVAKKEADGSVSQSCINDLESAANFFDIDPALLGVAAPVSKAEPYSSKLPIR